MDINSFHYSKAQTLKHCFVYLLLFFMGDLGSSILLDLLFSVFVPPVRALYTILRMMGCLIFTWGLLWLYTTKYLHLSMRDFQITRSIKKWGIFYAVLLPVFVLLSYLVIGEASMRDADMLEIFWILLASLSMAIKAGILEEMVFRGFIMKLLEHGWGKKIAIVLPSFLFSVLHLPSMNSFSMVGVGCLLVSGTLVGILFSLVAYKGKSIGNSALLHGVWNLVFITDILHITTVEGAYGAPLFSITIPSDKVLLTGGDFGMEASIIAILGYLLICGLVFYSQRGNQEISV